MKSILLRTFKVLLYINFTDEQTYMITSISHTRNKSAINNFYRMERMDNQLGTRERQAIN
jgi:hypothetical protein